jgi:hypothetical protein
MSRLDDRGASGISALTEGFVIAWAAIKANLLRSLLTILGVAVGVSVVVAIGALMTGLRSSVLDAFESAGPNNFVVSRFDFTAITVDDGNNRPPWWGKPEIEPEEARRISNLPSVQDALYDLSQFQVDLEFEGERMESVITSGSDAGWSAYQAGDFVVGRDFTHESLPRNAGAVHRHRRLPARGEHLLVRIQQLCDHTMDGRGSTPPPEQVPGTDPRRTA